MLVKLLKLALIELHCRGLVPARVVEAAFKRWPRLRNL